MNKVPNLVDGQTLEIASFTEVPKEEISIAGSTRKKVLQLQNNLAPPIVSPLAPVNIVRRNLFNGTFQYRVQFIAPTAAQDPNYQSTTVVLQTPTGTVRFAASGAAGPIIFNAPQTTAPGSLALQQDNANASSHVGLGGGNSRALVQQ